jgi:hypothetical protein
MAEPTEPLVGQIVEGAKRPVPAIDGLSALTQIVETTHKFLQVHAEQATKRARLHVYQETEVGRIKAAESVLRNYFDQVFAERRSIYEEMFARLDRALDEGNNAALHSVVVGIVDIAKSSPLADMGDLAQVRAALDDPDQVWDL